MLSQKILKRHQRSFKFLSFLKAHTIIAWSRIKNVCFQRRYLPVINLHEVACLEHLATTLSVFYAFSAFFFSLMLSTRLKVFFGLHRWRKKPLSVKHSLTVTVTKFVVTSVMKIWSISGFRQPALMLSWWEWRFSDEHRDIVTSETNVSPFLPVLFCNPQPLSASLQPVIVAKVRFSLPSLR